MSERDLLEGLNDSLSMDELLSVPENQGIIEQDARLARLRGEPGSQERSIQAPDDGDLMGPRTPLKAFRQNYLKELERNPAVHQKLLALTQAEVGNQGPEAQQAFIESVFNRAASRKQSLNDAMQLVDRGGYYPGLGDINKVSPITRDTYDDLIKQVGTGSNVGNYATGNASGTVGFNKGPQVAAYGGERFGIEGPDESTMRGIAGGEIDPTATAAFTVPDATSTGRRKMADQPRGIMDFLTGGQQLQGQPQGGLLGMLGDPETMAYLAMIAKGASPYSNLDPNSMLSNAHKIAMQRQLQLQRQQENAIDNRRADEALGLRRQEYKEGRDERQAREADRIQLKRDTIEQQARDRKANAEALKVLGIPTAPSPDDTETSPGPQSSLPDAYTPPELSPTVATAMASAAPSTSTPQFTDLPTEETMGGAAGATGQTGQTGPNRDDQLKERVKNLTEAYQREGLTPGTRKLIADEIKATNDKIGVPEGMDPREYKKLKTKSEFTKKERAGEQAVDSNIVIQEINRASDLVTPGAPTTMIGKAARDIGIDTSPPTAGMIGEYAQYVGGTPARALRGNLATISGHVTVESLQKMREASPSGGAMGNISNFEDKLLGSLKGSLDQGLPPKELQYNLNRLRNYTHAIASGLQVTPQNAQAVLSGASIKQEAIEAIASGKNKAQVLQRLKKYGIDTRGLE